MPWLMDSRSRTDEIVAAVCELIEGGGVSAVTYRAIAERVRLSHSTVHDHYPDLSHLLKVTAHALARQREKGLSVRLAQEGVAGAISGCEDELGAVAVWLALRDQERIDPMLGIVFAEALERERQIILYTLEDEAGMDAEAATTVRLLADGLERAITSGEQPLPIKRAKGILERVQRGLNAAAEASAS
jgi:AcrR family transcriptional regulator